jgi:ArsR family transcriptional regulator
MGVDAARRAVEFAGGSDQLRALADPLRWRIVELLADEQLCVCHLTEELGVRQPLVSHHVKVLRDAGLVEGERFRYWTYYRLRPEALAALAEHMSGVAAAAPQAAEDRRPCC